MHVSDTLKTWSIFLIVFIMMTTTALAEGVSIESTHPYSNNVDDPANNIEHIWDIQNSSATQMRVHFEKFELGNGDYLRILDENNKELASFSQYNELSGTWSEWFEGNFLRIKLETNSQDTAYGFKIDNVDSRIDAHPESKYAESYHPYANNIEDTWDIQNPSATQMRVHFETFELGNGDYLRILDENNKELASFSQYDKLEEAWSEWFEGNFLRIKLETNSQDTAYGFKIDNVDSRIDAHPESKYAESYHPYANNIEDTWDIQNPSATRMRVHFETFELGNGDYLRILDENNKELASFSQYNELSGTWSEWFEGNFLRIKLETNSQDTAYGFKIDDVEPGPTSVNSTSTIPMTTTTKQANSINYTITVLSSTDSDISSSLKIDDISLIDKSSDTYNIKGEALDSDGIAYVSVNGNQISNSGSFDSVLGIKGDYVEIETGDKTGNVTTFKVQLNPEQPDTPFWQHINHTNMILGILASLVVLGGIKIKFSKTRQKDEEKKSE